MIETIYITLHTFTHPTYHHISPATSDNPCWVTGETAAHQTFQVRQKSINEFYHGNCQKRVQTNETGANYRIYLSVHRVMQIHALEKSIYYMKQCWEKENRR